MRGVRGELHLILVHPRQQWSVWVQVRGRQGDLRVVNLATVLVAHSYVKGPPSTYRSFGLCDRICLHCHALMEGKEEDVRLGATTTPLMEGKEEDVRLGVNKFREHQPIGTAAHVQDKDYQEPPPAPLFDSSELASWSFWRAGIAEFIGTLLFLYITVLTVMGVVRSPTKCGTVGIQGIAWAFGGMIFALVYCTAGISGTIRLSHLCHCGLRNLGTSISMPRPKDEEGSAPESRKPGTGYESAQE